MALPRPNPGARSWLPALLLAAALAAACADGASVQGITDAALSEADVPEGWQPADFDEAQGRTLFDVLPDLLTSNSEARLFVRAFQDETGLHRVATIIIEAEEPRALPGTPESERALASLAELLERQDALLTPEVLGGDPGTYFTPIDEPLPGSLRSRLVRLVDEGYLYSDSTIFATGGVMAVVTVWYPKDEGPFRDVDELAAVVEQRLHEYAGG